MGWNRILDCLAVCLILAGRLILQLFVAALAAKDLHDISNSPAAYIAALILKPIGADVVYEIKCTLWFYFFCGIGFLIVAIAIEETANGRGRIRYTILHFLYVGVYIYFVFIRTILDVSFIRRIYVLMTSTYIIAYSLGTDAYLFCVALQMYRSVHRKRRPIILAMTQPNVPSNPAVHQEELECLPVSGGNRATILTV